MNTKLAPIALFAYNRPKHLQRTIEALQANLLSKKSNLIVFSDGAKNEAVAPQVGEVRRYLKSVDGFCSVTVIEQKTNKGLADSIIGGVSEVIKEFGKIIVLEDDILVSPHFLDYMNEALNLYEDTDKVGSVNAYMYPIKDLPETFFMRASDCWGWGTWQRAWRLFVGDGAYLLEKIIKNDLVEVFDFYNSYPYLQMLKDQIKGKNDSWAIRWTASLLLEGKLGLYPGKSLTWNAGLDASGVHCGSDDKKKFGSIEDLSNTKVRPVDLTEDVKSARRIGDYMRQKIRPSVFRRVCGFLATIQKQILR